MPFFHVLPAPNATAQDRDGKLGLPASAMFTKVTPGSAVVPVDKVTSGLSYARYQGKSGQILHLDWDEKLLAGKGETPSLDLSIRKQDEWFAILFTGFINIPADGIYTFGATSQDGSSITIDDNPLLTVMWDAPGLPKEAISASATATYPPSQSNQRNNVLAHAKFRLNLLRLSARSKK